MYCVIECCCQCVSERLANEHAQAKDFGEADIYIYKCEANDDPVCILNVLFWYIPLVHHRH